MKTAFSSKLISVIILLSFSSSILLIGCTHESKDPDANEPMQLESDTQSPVQAQAQAQVQTQTTDQTTTKDEPFPDNQKVASAKNSLPEATYFNAENSIPTTTTENPATAENTEEDEGPAPKVPAVSQPTQPKKDKPSTKIVKFKLTKKSTAQVSLLEQGKSVKVSFTGTKIKSGKYMVFLEKNCKKSNKVKPVKVAQFIVKKGDKYSGKADTHAFTLKAGNSKSLRGKALVLYFGPRANTKLSCEMVK